MSRNLVPQTAVRIPPDLKEQLKEKAEREHWSLNQAVIEAIKLLIKDE